MYYSPRICRKCLISNSEVHQDSQAVRQYVIATDATPSTSEMADSGLETGSISPHENTTSDNSSADLEATQAAEYTSTNDDDSERLRDEKARNKEDSRKKLLVDEEHCESLNNDDYRGNGVTQSESSSHSVVTYSSLGTEHQPTSSSDNAQRSRLNAEEIFQYESQVLSEPFYESDCVSDENESFEFVEPPVLSTSSDHERTSTKDKSERKIQSDVEESGNTIAKAEIDRPLPADITGSSNSSTSGYYFIDASSLNDEVVDIVTTSTTKQQYVDDRPLSYFTFSSDYTTKEKSKNATEEQSCKFTPFKAPVLQTNHERVAEFERELKLTEYLQPLSNSRVKVKRADPAPEEKMDTSKPADKESLAVEIKEADSGESAHPSPCPDNNTKMSNDRDAKTEETKSNNDEMTERNENEKDASSTNEDRRPSLIRRNTFELDSNDEKLSVLRQEYERRQGSLVFQSAIPQYSGHRVDGDSLCHVSSDPVVPSATEPSISFTSSVQIAANTDQYPVQYFFDSREYEIDQTQTQKNYMSDNLNRSCTVYPVTKSASDKSILDYSTDSDDTSNRCSNSLPVTLNSILQKDHNRPEFVKRNKRSDEATPIISGGVSTADYSKPTDSPTVRRKTESTPIVSGGSVIMNKPEVKVKPSKMSSSMTAWVVDMSDCNKGEAAKCRSNSRTMSQSFSTSECVKKVASKPNNHQVDKHHGSLGFFVNLKDMHDVRPAESDHSIERKRRDSKSYCEFYVDISEESNDIKAKLPEKQDTNFKVNSSNEGEKKNIFSMFIDLSDTSGTNSKDSVVASKHRRSFSTVPNKLIDTNSSRKDDNSSRDNSSATGDTQSLQEQKREKMKPSPVFMFIESDSPVVRRRALSTSRPAFKRHSWNTDKTQPLNSNGNGNGSGSGSNGCVAKEIMFRREHKRAHSISIDNRDSGRIQTKTSSSSHSLSDAAKGDSYNHKISKTLLQERESNNLDTSSEDVFEFDVRDTPPNSHVELENERLRASVAHHRDYKELTSDRTENLEASETKAYEDEFSETSAWEKTCTESTEGQTRKSETFDISSGSGPSPDSDNHDYELTDLLNGEIPSVNDMSQMIAAESSNKISETRKSLNETIKKIECELKGPEYNNGIGRIYESRSLKKDEKVSGRNKSLRSDKTSSNFVRLSDLDKTPIVNHGSDVLTLKEDRSTYRMSSSIPETSWIESKLAMTRNSGPIRPVSKKLASVMSTSLPSKQKSPLEDLTGDGEGEGIISESDLSSMQSSMGRSGAGT